MRESDIEKRKRWAASMRESRVRGMKKWRDRQLKKQYEEKDYDPFLDVEVEREKKARKIHPDAERLIKKAKCIRSMSPKRQAVERAYQKVKAEIIEERPPVCEGCGTNQGVIDFSHRLSRKDFPHLIADKENIDLYCRERCHFAVENGMYDLLENGREVIDYIKKHSEVVYNEKTILREGKRSQ